jgi:hypothetical protein
VSRHGFAERQAGPDSGRYHERGRAGPSRERIEPISAGSATVPFSTLAGLAAPLQDGSMRSRRLAGPLCFLFGLAGCGGEAEDSTAMASAASPEAGNDEAPSDAEMDPASAPSEDTPGDPDELHPVPEDPSTQPSTEVPGPRRCEPGPAPIPEPGLDLPTPEPAPDDPEVSAPEPALVPTSTDPAEPGPVPAAPPDGVEFIPWADFAMTNTLGPMGGVEVLAAPVEVRSVSAADGHDGEDFVMAVATETGDNAVVAIDVDGVTFRNHWPHFACGDCQLSSDSLGTALLTSDTLYASSDGGHRYYEVGTGDFSDRSLSHVRAVSDRIWVRGATGWLGAPFDGSEYLSAPPWEARAIASVDQESGLEVSARYITRHSDAGESSNANVCATVPDISFGSAYHQGQFVVTLCDEATVWVFDDFPSEPTEFSVDEAVTWVGATLVATANGWYGVSAETRGDRLGDQATLAEGEQVFGHIATEGVALRITSHGVALSQLTYGARLTEPAGPDLR